MDDGRIGRDGRRCNPLSTRKKRWEGSMAPNQASKPLKEEVKGKDDFKDAVKCARWVA